MGLLYVGEMFREMGKAQDQGINPFFDIWGPLPPTLLPVVLLFWSPSINGCIFLEGFLTPTIEDMFVLPELPPNGRNCHLKMFKQDVDTNFSPKTSIEYGDLFC